MLDVDFGAVAASHARSGLPALMTVFRNSDDTERSNCCVIRERVIAYDKTNPPRNARWIDYGLLGFTPRVFEEFMDADLSDIQRRLAERQQMGAFIAENQFHDIGTPETLARTEEFLNQGLGKPGPRLSFIDHPAQ